MSDELLDLARAECDRLGRDRNHKRAALIQAVGGQATRAEVDRLVTCLLIAERTLTKAELAIARASEEATDE